MSDVWGLRVVLDHTVDPGYISFVPLSVEALRQAVDSLWARRHHRLTPLPPMCRCAFEPFDTDIPATVGRNGGENMPEIPATTARVRVNGAVSGTFAADRFEISDGALILYHESLTVFTFAPGEWAAAQVVRGPDERDDTIAELREEVVQRNAEAMRQWHRAVDADNSRLNAEHELARLRAANVELNHDNDDLEEALSAAHDKVAHEYSRGYSDGARAERSGRPSPWCPSQDAFRLGVHAGRRLNAEDAAGREAAAYDRGRSYGRAEIRDVVSEALSRRSDDTARGEACAAEAR